MRNWQVKRWIACVLEFKGRRRPLLRPGRFTELFFLDEATALAAGHRPCAECRRADFNRFRDAWAETHPGASLRVDDIDRVLHAERVGPGRTKRLHDAVLGDLPDGSMIADGPQAWLLRGTNCSPGPRSDTKPAALPSRRPRSKPSRRRRSWPSSEPATHRPSTRLRTEQTIGTGRSAAASASSSVRTERTSSSPSRGARFHRASGRPRATGTPRPPGTAVAVLPARGTRGRSWRCAAAYPRAHRPSEYPPPRRSAQNRARRASNSGHTADERTPRRGSSTQGTGPRPQARQVVVRAAGRLHDPVGDPRLLPVHRERLLPAGGVAEMPDHT